MHKKLLLTAGLATVLTLAACTQTQVKSEEYSGFLGGYSRLQEAKSPDGAPVMRWVSPDLKAGKYTKIILDPVTFYPNPRPTEQVSEEQLYAAQQKFETDLRREIGKEMPIVTKADAQTLRLRAAITGVDVSNKGFQFYEVLPIALVIQGTMLAAGQRSQEVAVYVEFEVRDAKTGKVLAQVVRKTFGENLSNESAKLGKDNIDDVFNVWAKDLGTALHGLR